MKCICWKPTAPHQIDCPLYVRPKDRPMPVEDWRRLHLGTWVFDGRRLAQRLADRGPYLIGPDE